MLKCIRIFLLIAVFATCKKDKQPEPAAVPVDDLTTPVITLSSPADSSIYHNGDTIFMSGSVTDNDLHAGIIEIKDDTTSSVYYSTAPYVHGLHTAVINFYWVVNVSQNSKATLTVSYTDHYPNTGTVLRKLILLL